MRVILGFLVLVWEVLILTNGAVELSFFNSNNFDALEAKWRLFAWMDWIVDFSAAPLHWVFGSWSYIHLPGDSGIVLDWTLLIVIVALDAIRRELWEL